MSLLLAAPKSPSPYTLQKTCGRRICTATQTALVKTLEYSTAARWQMRFSRAAGRARGGIIDMPKNRRAVENQRVADNSTTTWCGHGALVATYSCRGPKTVPLTFQHENPENPTQEFSRRQPSLAASQTVGPQVFHGRIWQVLNTWPRDPSYAVEPKPPFFLVSRRRVSSAGSKASQIPGFTTCLDRRSISSSRGESIYGLHKKTKTQYVRPNGQLFKDSKLPARCFSGVPHTEARQVLRATNAVAHLRKTDLSNGDVFILGKLQDAQARRAAADSDYLFPNATVVVEGR